MPVRPDRNRSGYPERGSRRARTEGRHRDTWPRRNPTRATSDSSRRPTSASTFRIRDSWTKGSQRSNRFSNTSWAPWTSTSCCSRFDPRVCRLRTADRGARRQDRPGRKPATRRVAAVEQRHAAQQAESAAPRRTRPEAASREEYASSGSTIGPKRAHSSASSTSTDRSSGTRWPRRSSRRSGSRTAETWSRSAAPLGTTTTP